MFSHWPEFLRTQRIPAPTSPILLAACQRSTPAFLSRTISTSPTRATKFAWFRGLGYLVLAGGSVYVVDRHFNASAIRRNLRTLYTVRLYLQYRILLKMNQGVVIATDYKLNFKPGQGENITALHERVAERLYNLLVDNGGLYIKIGA